jgi:hypothetical protein
MYKGKNILMSQNCGYAIKMNNLFDGPFLNARFIVIELYLNSNTTPLPPKVN